PASTVGCRQRRCRRQGTAGRGYWPPSRTASAPTSAWPAGPPRRNRGRPCGRSPPSSGWPGGGCGSRPSRPFGCRRLWPPACTLPCHLHLAARKADDGRPAGGAGGRHGEVLDEGVEGLGEVAVAVEEVEDLVEEEEHTAAGGLEDAAKGFRPGRRRLRSRS